MTAQFMNQKREPPISEFSMMGRPIPFAARQVGFEHCIEMGADKDTAYECVGAVSEALSRDKPYEAMGAGMRYLDLTGTYRLMAVLLSEAFKLTTNGEKPPAGCKTRQEYKGNYRKYLIGWFKEPIKVQK